MSEENKGKNEIQKEKVLQAKSGFGPISVTEQRSPDKMGQRYWELLL